MTLLTEPVLRFPTLEADVVTELGADAAEKLLDAYRATLTPAVVMRAEPVGERPRRRGAIDRLLGRPAPPPPPRKLAPEQSKLCGEPYLEDESQWPRDARGQALAFQVQVNFAELPAIADLPRRGILSLFELRSRGDTTGFVWIPEPTGVPVPPPGDAPRGDDLIPWLGTPWPESRLAPQACWMLSSLWPDTILGADTEAVREGLIEWEMAHWPGNDFMVQVLGTGDDESDWQRELARRMGRPPVADGRGPHVRVARNVYGPEDLKGADPTRVSPEELSAWRVLLRVGLDAHGTTLFIHRDDLAAHRFHGAVALPY